MLSSRSSPTLWLLGSFFIGVFRPTLRNSTQSSWPLQPHIDLASSTLIRSRWYKNFNVCHCHRVGRCLPICIFVLGGPSCLSSSNPERPVKTHLCIWSGVPPIAGTTFHVSLSVMRCWLLGHWQDGTLFVTAKPTLLQKSTLLRTTEWPPAPFRPMLYSETTSVVGKNPYLPFARLFQSCHRSGAPARLWSCHWAYIHWGLPGALSSMGLGCSFGRLRGRFTSARLWLHLVYIMAHSTRRTGLSQLHGSPAYNGLLDQPSFLELAPQPFCDGLHFVPLKGLAACLAASVSVIRGIVSAALKRGFELCPGTITHAASKCNGHRRPNGVIRGAKVYLSNKALLLLAKGFQLGGTARLSSWEFLTTSLLWWLRGCQHLLRGFLSGPFRPAWLVAWDWLLLWMYWSLQIPPAPGATFGPKGCGEWRFHSLRLPLLLHLDLGFLFVATGFLWVVYELAAWLFSCAFCDIASWCWFWLVDGRLLCRLLFPLPVWACHAPPLVLTCISLLTGSLQFRFIFVMDGAASLWDCWLCASYGFCWRWLDLLSDRLPLRMALHFPLSRGRFLLRGVPCTESAASHLPGALLGLHSARPRF